MTGFITKINGTTYIMRNCLEFDVSYENIRTTFENESGRAIIYPVRSKKRTISVTIEANSKYLKLLDSIFNVAGIVNVEYVDDKSVCNCVLDPETIQRGEFIVNGFTMKRVIPPDIQVNNAGVFYTDGRFGAWDLNGYSGHEVSFTLEEV